MFVEKRCGVLDGEQCAILESDRNQPHTFEPIREVTVERRLKMIRRLSSLDLQLSPAAPGNELVKSFLDEGIHRYRNMSKNFCVISSKFLRSQTH